MSKHVWSVFGAAILTLALAAIALAQTTTQTTLSLGSLSLSLSLQTTLSVPSGQSQAATALSHADNISAPQLGYGRLDTYQAADAWRKSLGLR